jgi:phosphoribosylformylglycinamidine synthase subunit PurL
MSSAPSLAKALDEPQVTPELAASHGMNEEEYERLRSTLGREPTWTELGVTSALWSEHCSYKSSKVYLRELPTEGPHVVQGPGENAGIVDLGDDWVAAFKMESHNHPSYIEPYQGAATGVGGILRDVFTMGARPVAVMDSLFFGSIDAPKMRHLVDGVVRGVGDYGNCVGIPNVGGQTTFHPSFDGNILVNAFALGVARRDRIFKAAATGAGNPILYVGSRTGRDGIHGATMASESFGEESEAQQEVKRPTVQVGDPFTEKVLLEACLEAMRTGAIVAIQDMGAAGLTSSAFEMAERGGTGLELDLDKVPLREPSLGPYEIMLSESQERMLLVARRGREEEVERIYRRWGLEVSPIGRVTPGEGGEGGGRALLRWHGETVADLPVAAVTENAPLYRRPVAAPKDLAERQAPPEVPEVGDPVAVLRDLLDTPDFGSKRWIWRQYDHSVRTNTVRGPGSDAAVLMLKGTSAGIALAADVNPVYCYLDPRTGAAQAVAEAVRNLACAGAEPLGMTDCLNFGNPERPEIMWQFQQAIRGMSDACRALGVPVVSGNVSFYNETGEKSVHPAPNVAVVGLIPDLDEVPYSWFVEAGHRILLLGESRSQGQAEFGGAAWLRLAHGIEQGAPPRVDLAAEARLAELLRTLAFQGTARTAHDLSEGGLAMALAEAAMPRGLGVEVRTDLAPAELFGESQGRALVACAPKDLERVLRSAERAGVPAAEIGEVGGADLTITCGGERFAAPVEELRRTWETALPRALESC